MKKLFPEPFRTLVTDVCKLPPQRFSSGSGENPVDINIHNLAHLMSKAFVMSVLLGMTYLQKELLSFADKAIVNMTLWVYHICEVRKATTSLTMV